MGSPYTAESGLCGLIGFAACFRGFCGFGFAACMVTRKLANLVFSSLTGFYREAFQDAPNNSRVRGIVLLRAVD